MTESSQAYVEDKLAALDRDFLLTRLFAAPSQRRALAAIHALRAELRTLALRVSDPGVAMSKIAWWQEEWGRLAGGRARHPVTAELQHAGVTTPSLEGALAATAGLIHGATVETQEQVDALVRALAEPPALLEAQLCAIAPPREDWRCIQWVALLEDLSRLAALGRAPVPLDLLAACQLRRDGLAGDPLALATLRREMAAMAASRGGLPYSHAGIYRCVQQAKLAVYRAGKTNAPGAMRRLWAAWHGARAVRRAT